MIPAGSDDPIDGSSNTQTSSPSTSSTSAQSNTAASTGGGAVTTTHNTLVSAVKLPKVSCHQSTARNVITLSCSTSGGSNVPTTVRARVLHGRRLISNVASTVQAHTVRFTFRLGRNAAPGRYTIRLSVDAGGRVAAITRYAQLR